MSDISDRASVHLRGERIRELEAENARLAADNKALHDLFKANPSALWAEVARLRETLTWYGEQARLCRLIHSEGDAGRHALADDGGKRAREVAILAAHAQGFVDDPKEAMRRAALSAKSQSTS